MQASLFHPHHLYQKSLALKTKREKWLHNFSFHVLLYWDARYNSGFADMDTWTSITRTASQMLEQPPPSWSSHIIAKSCTWSISCFLSHPQHFSPGSPVHKPMCSHHLELITHFLRDLQFFNNWKQLVFEFWLLALSCIFLGWLSKIRLWT